MSAPRHDLESEYVHVTQRGIGHRLIFEDDADKTRFLGTLAKKSESLDVAILAWCLMDNHFHLLVRAEPEQLSSFMQRTLISYAQYFNGRHGHVGKVFQNRFRSQAVLDDSHLLAAIRYHTPERMDAGIADPAAYRWSSFRECAGLENAEFPGLCDAKATVALFGSADEFARFHEASAADEETFVVPFFKPRLNDSEAKGAIAAQLGEGYCDKLASMPKPERDAQLRRLKQSGLSVRQIERLTGIGRGIVARA